MTSVVMSFTGADPHARPAAPVKLSDRAGTLAQVSAIYDAASNGEPVSSAQIAALAGAVLLLAGMARA